MERIPVAEPNIGDEELKNVIDVVKSGWISSKGKFIRDFESLFAHYHNVKYGIAVSNGTVALHLALCALNIGSGDEVIIPDLTFIATANVVRYCNAKPVFVDINPKYWCLDPSKIEEKITSKTKAIIPVHLYGHPCDMAPIQEIAEKYGLFIIEDCAEAHGAEYKHKKVGTFGDIGCFSFYGNKIITTGEGGMCITNNEDLAEKMYILRDHGMNRKKKYWHDVIGFNYRMTNIQAAIGLAQLRKLDQFIIKKRDIARYYTDELNVLVDKGLITLHPEMHWAKNVYWLYSILLNKSIKKHRALIMRKLEKCGIETRPFFYPIHKMPPYFSEEAFQVSEDVSTRGFNLPSSTKLTKEQIHYISTHLKAIIKEIL